MIKNSSLSPTKKISLQKSIDENWIYSYKAGEHSAFNKNFPDLKFSSPTKTGLTHKIKNYLLQDPREPTITEKQKAIKHWTFYNQGELFCARNKYEPSIIFSSTAKFGLTRRINNYLNLN